MGDSYNIETFRNEIYNEMDMLRGNINRMNVATEIKELTNMYEFLAVWHKEEILKYDGDLVVKVINLDRDDETAESVWLSSDANNKYVVIM